MSSWSCWTARPAFRLLTVTLSTAQVMTKPVLYVVNKIDGMEQEDRLYDFYSIGVEDLYPLSAEHGYGINDFLDHLVDELSDIIAGQAPKKAKKVSRLPWWAGLTWANHP